MVEEAPPSSLITLCIDHLANQLLFGEDEVIAIIPVIYELPSHLLDDLISRLTPHALYHFHLHMPFQDVNEEDFSRDDSTNNKRKRSRDWNLNTAWQKLFELRWPDLINQIQPSDWQKAYWEAHLQNCLDEAAEIALISPFKGRLADINISESILRHIGFVRLAEHEYDKYSKLSYHCLQFGSHVSCLRLQNILCSAETTRLLRECKLQSMVVRCIRSVEQVNGLCRLINQHSRTLTSLEFIHCTLYENFLNTLLDSVVRKSIHKYALQKHGLQHLSIVSSSFGPCTGSLPTGLQSLLSSARSMCSLKLCGSRLGRNFAKALFVTLLSVSSCISVLDLAENEISGCLSHFNRRVPSYLRESHIGIGESLQLLRVLNLRGNNLRKDDAENLGYAFAYMPNLEDLDISDNPIEDEGLRYLIPYFAGTSEMCSRLACLKLEACDLSCDVVNHLLDSLPVLNGTLKSLSIAENCLGSKVAGALGRFLSTPIEVLDASGIDLLPSGFLELQNMLTIEEELSLVIINISKNRGGIQTARFLSKLLPQAPRLVDVNASSNCMPIESLSIISSALKFAKGNVLNLVQGLDESKNAMAMVTEPLFASVANTLGKLDNVQSVPKDLKGMEMGLLEVKHGLLQIAESLDFLHNHAHLIHRAIAPENVFITLSGAWKLGGFGFAISSQNTGDSSNLHAFHYAEYDVEDSVLPLQPSINYTAPEMVRSTASSAGCYSDIFSFGCLAYHLIARKPLFDCNNNVKMYMNTLTYLSSDAFSSIPSDLVPDLQRMLSSNESFRPSAMDFTGSPFFRNDTRLRALRFLDHMLERDNMQKSEFLKALSDMWKDFDSRVLRYKVLPPLCAELRNVVIQPMILPMVLTIAESQDKNDFEQSTLPALVPVLSTASGDTMLLLLKHAELIINKTSQDHLISHVLPMIVRAYDDNDSRLQEEVLKKSVSLAKQLDTQLVKQVILPRVHGLALKTTVAAVRVNALLCLGDMVNRLDKHAALEILQTIQRCTAVDRSPPTLMCTLGVANSIFKQYGVEFVAEHVLPLLMPLLTAQQLNVQQFAKYMLFVKNILQKIEEKRGVAVTDSGIPEVKLSPAVNGLQVEAPRTASSTVASTKSSFSWDADWGPKAAAPTNSVHNSINTSNKSVLGNPVGQVTSLQNNLPLSGVPNPQTSNSCPSVDLEWPPRASSGLNSQFGDTERKTVAAGTSSTSNLEDDDPFADWPPRPSGSLSGVSGNSNNGISGMALNKIGHNSMTSNSSNLGLQASNNWSVKSQNSVESIGLNPRNASSSISNPNNGFEPQSSLGFLKQSQAFPVSNAVSSSYNNVKSTDLGSIFSSNKNEQLAPRLAPPPSTTVGRGRGRGRGATSSRQHSHTKSSSEQPPLLDLLG